MLNPDNRQLYMEVLRPPAGFTFDRGVATTFSLDLTTLLMVPLSLAMFECRDEKEILSNPIKVLEALRRSAQRLTVFCQRGRISIPPVGSLLYGLLENMVIEVAPLEENGVFHPKVWILRFIGEGKVKYKFLCLSRNITFDRSWDTLLALEGDVAGQEVSTNRPLSDFIRHLPELAGNKASDKIKKDMNMLSLEIMNVIFNPPEGFDEQIRFWPLGIPGYTQFPVRGPYERLMVVSPFLSESLLCRFDEGAGKILISREDSLDGIDFEFLKGYKEVYILDEEAEGREEQDGEKDLKEGLELQKLTGLHVKLYMTEYRKMAKLWSGSANATNAAFGSNIEFLVELTGNKARIGIDQFLGGKDKGTVFRNLLKTYIPPSNPPDDVSVEKQLEELLETVREKLSTTGLNSKVVPVGSGYDLELTSEQIIPESLISGVKVECWPVTMKNSYAQSIDPLFTGGKIVFKSLSPVAVTGFIALRLSAGSGRIEKSLSFVLNIPLEGLPSDRDNLILQSVIADRNSFIRYILFLLADEEMTYELSELIRGYGNTARGGTAAGANNRIPLMEELLRALSRKPEKIDSIARLVEDLRRHPDGQKLLPDGFDAIWQPIWKARRGMVVSR